MEDHFTISKKGEILQNVHSEEAYQIYVIGDSIAWGNELGQEEKYYFKTAKTFQESLKIPVEVTVYAHSGAVITDNPDPLCVKEVRFGTGCPGPTLMQQAEQISNDVDLVLVSGGINDVDIFKNLINNKISLNDVKRITEEKIKEPMKILLEDILNKNENVKVVVTGYFQVKNPEDNKPNSNPVGIGQIFQRSGESYVKSEVISHEANFKQFYDTSSESLQYSVAAANKGENRVVFVDPKFQEADTNEPLLYTFRADGISSTAHPTPKGAQRYADRIKEEIVEKYPDWLILGSQRDPYTQNPQDSFPPIVQAFKVTPLSLVIGESISIDYSVSDNDGSGLKQVEIWRKDVQSEWQEIKSNAAFGKATVSGTFKDTPPATGNYWYGLHVVDNAGNWNDERNSKSEGSTNGFEPNEVEVKEIAVLTLYIHDGSTNGPTIPGTKITGKDGSNNRFDQTTDSRGYVTIKGTPGTWSFSASANGYETNNWDQEITETDTKDAFLRKNNVVLTLYVHSGNAKGPIISDAKVKGQDGEGNAFDQNTDSNGYTIIKGTPGTWSFSASAKGYETNNWDQEITETDTKDAFMQRYKPNQLSGAALPIETSPLYHNDQKWAAKGSRKMGRPAYQPQSSTSAYSSLYAPQPVVTPTPSGTQGYDSSVVGKWLMTGIEVDGLPFNYYVEFYNDGTYSGTCRYVELNELQDTIVNGNNALGCETGDWTQSGNNVHAKIQNGQTTYELTINGDSMNGFDIYSNGNSRSISGERIHEGEFFP